MYFYIMDRDYERLYKKYKLKYLNLLVQKDQCLWSVGSDLGMRNVVDSEDKAPSNKTIGGQCCLEAAPRERDGGDCVLAAHCPEPSQAMGALPSGLFHRLRYRGVCPQSGIFTRSAVLRGLASKSLN